MREMLFYSPKRRKPIIFDDWVDNTEEYDSYWAEMCPQCYKKYKKILGKRVSNGAQGTCSVKGCINEADYYIDFYKHEVTFKENEVIENV